MKIIQTIPGTNEFCLFENLTQLIYSPAENINNKHAENINTDFLTSCYVLTVNNVPKARLALYNNPYLIYNGMKSACIGYYECVDEPEVSKKILSKATEEAKKLNADFLIGPMNGSTWDNYRFSTNDNYPVFMLEPRHHLYYNSQLMSAGFNPIAKYTSSIDRTLLYNLPETTHLENSFLKKGVIFRNINMNNYEGELDKLYPFIASAFKTNFLYTPISKERFYNKYSEAAKIINPEFVIIAEDFNGDIIGFVFCYDDLLNVEEKSLVIKTLARDSSKQWRGLGSVLANKVVRLAKNRGYNSIIYAFMMEKGTSAAASESFSGNAYKNYVLYGMKL
jgi:GNAT superfamily N-acetyltransferase